MESVVKTPKKLIEVALPLDAINEACAYEKMPGIGPHPRGIHLWWARRPLAAARAVIFSQLVNDPSWKWELEHHGEVPPNHLKASWASSRKRLFDIIGELVKWENSKNDNVLDKARAEILKSWQEVCELNKDHPEAARLFNAEIIPGIHDPFAGGGAIPIEAQRLGLDSFASDLNPVAVLINKAVIEIPARFRDQIPIGPTGSSSNQLGLETQWSGPSGLVEDVRRYGQWILNEAKKNIGTNYPPVLISADIVSIRPELKPLLGQELPVIAWLWARTVKSPNPAFSNIDVPLVSTFVLTNKKGKEAYVHPVIDGTNYRFEVKTGNIPNDANIGTKASGKGANFRCILSGVPIGAEYIRAEGQAGRIKFKLLAIVVSGKRSRIYLPPNSEAERIANAVQPSWKPEVEFFKQALGFRIGNYGMSKWDQLFTPRQLLSLSTFSDLVEAAKVKAFDDAVSAGFVNDGIKLENKGKGATAYSEALGLYLAFAVDRCADFSNSLSRWGSTNEKIMNLFGSQTIRMTWDFAEANVLESVVGGFYPAVEYIADCMETLVWKNSGHVKQADAQNQDISQDKFISTDPPYYSNIGYADLSDFFYVWLRKTLKTTFPNLLATITVPKDEELVATPGRHGGDDEAQLFFMDGMTQFLKNIAKRAHPAAPVTIYYAFKQSETNDDSGTSSTGWDTFLTAVIKAGFSIVGTWPLRSEQEFRMRGMGANALASSIVLVCRQRDVNAVTIDRRGFLRELNQVLPEALDEMTKGSSDNQSPVRPADLSQAIIGPGMAIFSKYASVLEADGTTMTVQTALRLINRYLAGDDLDLDSQFCLQWFEEHGWETGKFGDADNIARSKGTSVEGIKEAGIVESGSGKVRLRKWVEYPNEWTPNGDARNPIWETLHQLIRALKQDGETAAGIMLGKNNGQIESVRQLAYRLYTLCERNGWADDARAYNELITSWSGIEVSASRTINEGQLNIFGE